ncbi:nodulation protein NolW [Bradyrhizobium sp. BEA-2-5]|uniref:nodulation protein NolW n=1 Tax=Bradyrhizobium sp. BEA-2-5 TaxID=3080015 RepID=UPI00293E7305|nr:nodulation protein NolW [Bradyrhizobium sp. BEA-2-5]WOH80240.1 nodulation protein NolW [Bradyrhizobium sp. BEA-2-5]
MFIPFMIQCVLIGILCVGAFVSTGNRAAFGAPLSLSSTPYRYTVLDQDLPAALQEFGNNLNVRINISSEVKGRIRGHMPDLSPREFLDHLTQLYNLQWYYDGLVLYLSAAKEAQTRLLLLGPISFGAFTAALDALNISDERYTIRAAPGNGLVLASGPPRFIALVDETLKGLVTEAQARPRAVETPTRDSVLTLFRGSSTTIIRDGKPEGPYSLDNPHQDGVRPAPALGQK